MNLQFARRTTQGNALPGHATILAALTALRCDWETTAEGESLIQVNASVGLLLLDVATYLGLTQEEQKLMLGTRLHREAVETIQKH